MSVDVCLKKDKENIWVGTGSSVLSAGDSSLKDIPGDIEDLLKSIDRMREKILVHVAYSPKSKKDLDNIIEEVEGDIEYLTECSSKLGLLYFIKNKVEDEGYSVEVS